MSTVPAASPSIDPLYGTVCSLSSALRDGSRGRHVKSHLFTESLTSPDAVVASCDSGAACKILIVTYDADNGLHGFCDCIQRFCTF